MGVRLVGSEMCIMGRDTPSAQAKQRILCIRCLGAFLETGSLHPPLAALRLFSYAVKILHFQSF